MANLSELRFLISPTSVPESGSINPLVYDVLYEYHTYTIVEGLPERLIPHESVLTVHAYSATDALDQVDHRLRRGFVHENDPLFGGDWQGCAPNIRVLEVVPHSTPFTQRRTAAP